MSKEIDLHNKPLHDAMVAKGCRFHVGKQYQHFVDANGKYVSYPPGYITGPFVSQDNNGNPNPLYISVQGPDGWHQRSFKVSERDEAIKWALECAKNIKPE